jgi:hypothetical protein
MAFNEVVAVLHAAGNDEDALQDAIRQAEAAGLDEVPGEDRQKLRGKRWDPMLLGRRGRRCGMQASGTSTGG